MHTFRRGTTEKSPRKLTTNRNPMIHASPGSFTSFMFDDCFATRALIAKRYDPKPPKLCIFRNNNKRNVRYSSKHDFHLKLQITKKSQFAPHLQIFDNYAISP